VIRLPVQPGSSYVPHNPDGMRQTSILPHTATIPPHILQQLYAGNFSLYKSSDIYKISNK